MSSADITQRLFHGLSGAARKALSPKNRSLLRSTVDAARLEDRVLYSASVLDLPGMEIEALRFEPDPLNDSSTVEGSSEAMGNVLSSAVQDLTSAQWREGLGEQLANDASLAWSELVPLDLEPEIGVAQFAAVGGESTGGTEIDSAGKLVESAISPSSIEDDADDASSTDYDFRASGITNTSKIYFSDQLVGRIERANPDGNNREELVTGLFGTAGIGLFADASTDTLYWTQQAQGLIRSSNLDGTNVQDVLTGLSSPRELTVDNVGGKIYWSEDGSSNTIRRADIDGNNVEDLVSTGLSGPGGIALDTDNGKVYWVDTDNDVIQRSNLDGTSVEDVITGLAGPRRIKLDTVGGKMYWTDDGSSEKIRRANLDGTSIEDLVTTGLSGPTGLDLDLAASKMYWTDFGTRKVQRANLDGSGVEDLVTTGFFLPVGMGVAIFSNTQPTANAGTNQTIAEGDALSLDGSGSFDLDGESLSFSWDLDNDGNYEELGEPTTSQPTVSWSTLQSFGIDDDGNYTIGLRVEDGSGSQHTDDFSITVTETAPELTLSGPSIVGAGNTYELSLTAVDPGDDTISSWTINWGDGNIETVAVPSATGSSLTATHVYSNVGFTHNILTSATDEDGTYLQAELVATGYRTDSVFRFAGDSGNFVQEFANNEPLTDPIDAVVGPDGNLYISGESSRNVLRYSATTGAFIDEFVTAGTAGLSSATGLAFGPDGNLYVADYTDDIIRRFDGSTGNYIDDFVSANSAGLTGPYGIVFGPDAELYVNSYDDGSVLRYDGSAGTFIDEFVASGSGGLNNPKQMVFGPDGHLYVTSLGTDEVLRFNGSTGAFVDDFVSANSGGLTEPAGVAFGADGNLYVSDFDTSAIRRYDGSTGAFIDDFVAATTGGLNGPAFITFVPQQQVLVGNFVNGIPTADSGGPYSINEGQSLTLDASASSDPDSHSLSFSWDLNNDSTFGDVTTDSPTVSWATLQSLGIADDGSFAITLQVNDGNGGINTATTTLTVANVAPTPTSPTVVSVNENATVVDTITASDPVDSLAFNISGGADQLRFTIDTVGELAFVAPPNFEAPADVGANNIYDVEVTVADGDGGSFVHSMAVTVLDVNEADPVVTALQSFSVSEFANNGFSLGSVAATDADTSDTLSGWTITSGNSDGVFAIASGTGELTVFDDTNLDFETTNSYTLSVRVSDGLRTSDVETITVNVTNENELPTAVTGAYSIDEGSSLSLNGSGSTDPDTDTLSFAWDVDNDGSFGGSGEPSTALATITWSTLAALGVDDDGSYSIGLQVDDGLGGLDATTTTLTVSNVAPTFTSSSNVNVVENSTFVQTVSATDPVDNVTLSITGGDDQGQFTLVSATNSLQFIAAPDFELPADLDADNVYQVAITADDGDGGVQVQNVSVVVDQQNETPTGLTVSTLSVAENTDTAGGLSLGVLSAIDEDVADSFAYSVAGGLNESAFSIGGVGNNELILADGVLDFERQSSYSVRLRVTDLGALVFERTVVISVTNENETPQLALNNVVADILDTADTTSSTKIADIVVSDEDATNVNVTGVTGADASQFVIVGSELHLASGVVLDHVTNPSLDVAVYVDDPSISGGPEDTVLMSLSVLDGTPPPIAANDSYASTDGISIIINAPGVLSNDTNQSGSSVTVDIVSRPGHGTLSLAADGSFAFEPIPGFVGTDQFTYQVSDGVNTPSLATVTLEVNSIVPPPAMPAARSSQRNSDSQNDSDESSVPATPTIALASMDPGAPSPTSNSTDKRSANRQTDKLGGDAALTDATTVIQQDVAETDETRDSNSYRRKSLTRNVARIDKSDAEHSREAELLQDDVNFIHALDDFRDEVNQPEFMDEIVIGSSVALSTGLSVGYVIWLIRGGVLLSSVLSSLPAWQLIDPLPVLGYSDNDDVDDDDESLETLVTRQRPNVRNVTPRGENEMGNETVIQPQIET